MLQYVMRTHPRTFRIVTIAALLLVLCAPAGAEGEGRAVTFGVAEGYPPYQFRNEDGSPAGLDVDVIKLIGERLGIEVRIVQKPWDDVVTALRVGKVDCVGGMEINVKRRSILDFTASYYSRKSAVFTLENNRHIRTIRDLKGRIIAGDRHSYVEERLRRQSLRRHIRIRQIESKDKSLRLLKEGKVVAVVAPKAVGYHLASRHNIAVRIIDDTDPGSPVGLAVVKGNIRLRDLLDRALEELRESGELNAVLRKWCLK